MARRKRQPRIEAFDFEEDQVLAKRYRVVERLGGGWEGEVYKVKEISTGIERTAKFWYPQRNRNNRAARFYAKKLHKLRHCPILIQYTHMDRVDVEGVPISFLVSDYVEGEILNAFLKSRPKGRLSPFQGLHLLYALTRGMEQIHHAGDYHGDLHAGNIIVERYGLGFDLKLLDFFHRDAPKFESMQDDLVDIIRVFYDALGGSKRYRYHPPEVKEICCGMRRNMILKKFRRTSHLRSHLESMTWS
jgi:serine/threonine protein kinase